MPRGLSPLAFCRPLPMDRWRTYRAFGAARHQTGSRHRCISPVALNVVVVTVIAWGIPLLRSVYALRDGAPLATSWGVGSVRPVRCSGMAEMTEDEDLPSCGRCGYCGSGSVIAHGPLRDEDPLDSDKEWPPAAVYLCLSCWHPSVGILSRHDGRVTLKQQSPHPRPEPLGVHAFRNTTILAYRTEAWNCYLDGSPRAAIVTARSALQACCRRYLPKDKWSRNFGKEVAALAVNVGLGWEKLGSDIRSFGNDWAHPDPSEARVPTSEEALQALQRMDAVLRFTGDLERFSHLTALNSK